jgi:two-component system cell cycle response regulator
VPARVLVVEDNPTNLELMSYLLESFGHTALTAIDGGQGLEAVCREKPDLVICDVQLPVMDGYTVARQLKVDPILRRVPLIAVTALAMVGDRDKVLAAGFDGYIAKPINPETFVRQVETFLAPNQRMNRLPPSSPSIPVPIRPATGQRILVVDDLPTNLELARGILEPLGYQVFTANGMESAMTQLGQIRCDLILSDVCMGSASGYEFIKAVKAIPEFRAIPFLFITSTFLEAKDRLKGLALGAARFLTRPMEPLDLAAEIEACLQEHKRT